MNSTLESCLHSCQNEISRRLESLDCSHYRIVDIDNNGFTIVPVKGSSFYSWEHFTEIVKSYNIRCYFRIYTYEDYSVSVCLRVIL